MRVRVCVCVWAEPALHSNISINGATLPLHWLFERVEWVKCFFNGDITQEKIYKYISEASSFLLAAVTARRDAELYRR